MDFSSYLQKRLSAGGAKSLYFGSLTNDNLSARLKNISLFSSASLNQINNIDLTKIMSGEVSGEEQALGDIVSALMELEEVQKLADVDGDGEISSEEAQSFLQKLMANDGNSETFSMKDIDAAIEQLGINLEKAAETAIANALEEADTDEVEETKQQEKTEAPQQTQSSAPASGGSSAGGGSRVGGGNSASPSSTKSTGETKGESAEDIEKQITEEENNKAEIKSKMESDIAEQENAITDAMNDKDSGFPDGFQEKYEKEKEKINEDIKSKDSEIEKQKGIVQDKTAEIKAAETSISSLNEQKGNLESQLASVSADDENASTQKSDIQSKIDNVAHEIETKEKEKSDAEKAKDDAEKEQEKLEKEKAALVDKKDNLLDEMIKENKIEVNPETKKKIQEAQDKIKEIRTSAEKEIADSDTKIQDLKTKLEEVKQKEQTDKVISENSVYNGNIDKGLASAIDAKCGAGFCAKVEEIAKKLNCDPNDLLGMMYSESGLNSKAVNGSSGATGLIQFMPSTANGLGTSTASLASMSPVEQLDWVEKYYDVNKKAAGIADGQKLEAGQLYALVFLPAYANKSVLTTAGQNYYNANSGLDTDKNGDISIADLTQRVKAKYNELYNAYV